jgi:hypothetical protein
VRFLYLLVFRLWNYNPDNNDREGDKWNGENFSWFSRGRALPKSLLYYDQDSPSLDNGGRILPAIVRPYAAKTAGIPLRFRYEMTTGEFEYEWSNPTGSGSDREAVSQDSASVELPPIAAHTELSSRETEIFVPSMITEGRKLIVRGLDAADAWVYDKSRQTLFVLTDSATPGRRHHIEVSLNPPLDAMFEVNDFWSDFGGHAISVAFVIFAFLIYCLNRLM